jgi:transcription antitermination factor NusG
MVEMVEACTPDKAEWFAVHTYAKHEKNVTAQLIQRKITVFTPTLRQSRVWSDRKKVIDVPLFPCYVFVQTTTWRDIHLPVVTVPGVLGWVGVHKQPMAIPEAQIETFRVITDKNVPASPYPFLNVGERVRIKSGALDGVEGVLVERRGGHQLVVSVDLIQKSVCVAIDGYAVEKVTTGISPSGRCR